MIIFFVMLLTFGAGFGAAMLYLSRKSVYRSGPPAFLLIYDGSGYSLFPARVQRDGVTAQDRLYQWSLLQRAVSPDGAQVAVLAAERPILAEHEAFEDARWWRLVTAAFAPGGQIVDWLRTASAIIPIITCVWLALQFGALNSTIMTQGAVMERLREILANPIQVEAVPR